MQYYDKMQKLILVYYVTKQIIQLTRIANHAQMHLIALSVIKPFSEQII